MLMDWNQWLLDDAYQCWSALNAASWRKIFFDDTKDDSGLPFTLAGSLIATNGEARVRICSGRVGQLVPEGKLFDNILHIDRNIA